MTLYVHLDKAQENIRQVALHTWQNKLLRMVNHHTYQYRMALVRGRGCCANDWNGHKIQGNGVCFYIPCYMQMKRSEPSKTPPLL